MDKHLCWKPHVAYISNKIKRSIGMISKARHFVNIPILMSLYYSMVYPYLTYGVVAWGNTYQSTIDPLLILQKKCVRLMTFAEFKAHTNPIFIKLKILKMREFVEFQTALFMHDYFTNNLPKPFDSFFSPVNQRLSYNTRLASRSTYTLPAPKTNYGKFNTKFSGSGLWNNLDETLKCLPKENFKQKLKDHFLGLYSTG